MALTFSDRDGWQFPPGLLGGRRIGTIKIALDSSYAAGGYAIAASDLSLKSKIDFLIGYDDFGGYVPVWDVDNQKLKVYYGDYSNGSDGPLVEFGSTDLSSVAGEFFYVGY